MFNRVTRLGEFSPSGRLFSLGSFFNYRSSPKLRFFFPWNTWLCTNFEQKMSWATFWAIFSQSRLVTLSVYFWLDWWDAATISILSLDHSHVKRLAVWKGGNEWMNDRFQTFLKSFFLQKLFAFRGHYVVSKDGVNYFSLQTVANFFWEIFPENFHFFVKPTDRKSFAESCLKKTMKNLSR
jgi:hypothetical protein